MLIFVLSYHVADEIYILTLFQTLLGGQGEYIFNGSRSGKAKSFFLKISLFSMGRSFNWFVAQQAFLVF